MKQIQNSVIWFLLLLLPLMAEEEYQTWRAVGGFKTEAAFVSYDAGVVTLKKKKDGELVQVRLERLMPKHRAEVIQLAGPNATGSTPRGQVQVPTGRRELQFNKIVRGDPWHPRMSDAEKNALLKVDRNWDHAETKYFIVHYQQLGYARRVARMADYFYPYIAADLPGYKDQVKEKSHIVVVKDRDDWKEFLELSATAPSWAGAYVRGKIMYVPDGGDRKQNADVLAHEMSHLVLNRFFLRPPPLWLNEGLAEWYEKFGWEAFKGQLVNVEENLGTYKNPLPLEQLFRMNLRDLGNDRTKVSRFYNTSREVVGMLKLRKDQQAFVKFLQMITVEGKPAQYALKEVYGFENTAAVQAAFDEFMK